MKTGIELIVLERKEQLESKGRTLKHDFENNSQGELIIVAHALMETSVGRYMKRPEGWSPEYWEKLLGKPYTERLSIAGALIAAEIDRLQNSFDKKNKKNE